jgi:ferredoxin-type protein NapG
MPDPSPKPIRRRDFFRRGLAEFLKPLDRALEPVKRVARHFDALDRGPDPLIPPPPPEPAAPTLLRPPGAIPEEQFLTTCQRCGNCAGVCPVHCIHIDDTRTVMGGAPYIDIRSQACVLCEGALERVESPAAVRMGTAQWVQDTCRQVLTGDCTLCVDRCPLGPAAIEMIKGQVVVHETGCTGCGVCHQVCPTEPRSIIIQPRTVPEATLP